MKKRMHVRQWFVLAALLIVACGSARAQQQEGISWLKDIKQATELAQKSNHPMLIDFWADWCGSCKVMEKEIYENPMVVTEVNEKFVPLRLNFDMQQELAHRYDVEALPHVVFADSYGTELMHHHGLLEAADLAAVLEAIPPDMSPFNRLDRILQEDKDDFGALVDMGQKLSLAGFFESGNGYFQRALKEKPSAADAARHETILFDLGNNWLELRDGKQAAEMLERCRKEFPQSARMPDILLGLGQAYALDQKRDKAKGALDALIAAYPQARAAEKARALLQKL